MLWLLLSLVAATSGLISWLLVWRIFRSSRFRDYVSAACPPAFFALGAGLAFRYAEPAWRCASPLCEMGVFAGRLQAALYLGAAAFIGAVAGILAGHRGSG